MMLNIDVRSLNGSPKSENQLFQKSDSATGACGGVWDSKLKIFLAGEGNRNER